MLVSMQNRIQQMPINNIGRNKSNQINFQGQWGNKVVEEHLNEIVNKKTIASMQGLLEGVFTGLKKARTLDLLEAMAEKISDLTKSLNESQQEANSTKQELSQKTKDNGNLTDRNNWLQQAVTNLQNLKTENEKEIAGLNEKVNELEKFKTKFGEIKPMSQVEGLTPEEVIDTMQQLHDNRTEYFEALDNYLFDNDSTNKGFDPKLLDVLHKFELLEQARKEEMFKIDRVTNKAKEFWGDNYSYVIGRNATGLAINMIEMTLKTSDKNDYLNASKYSKQVFTNASRLLQYVFIESLEKQLNDPNSTWGQRNDLKLQIKNTAERIASGVQTAIENAVGFQQKFNRGVEIAEGDLRAGWRLGVNKNKYEPWNVVYTDPNNKDTTYNEGYVIEWANRRG